MVTDQCMMSADTRPNRSPNKAVAWRPSAEDVVEAARKIPNIIIAMNVLLHNIAGIMLFGALIIIAMNVLLINIA